MRYKIESNLNKAECARMADFLDEKKGASIELFSGIDLEFISVSPLVVSAESLGYSIKGEISFQQPIGLQVQDDLRLDDKMISADLRTIRVSKLVTEPGELESALNECLKMLERIVNHTCSMFDKQVEETFTLHSEWLDKQYGMIYEKEELKKRGETPKPFGTIHAKDSGDARERAGDLVPVYMERDKAYLYEDKKVFMLLPRNFVMKLLKIGGPIMIAADQFTDEEREALDGFSTRQYVRKTRVGGKTYYYDLDETTRKLLLRNMKKT